MERPSWPAALLAVVALLLAPVAAAQAPPGGSPQLTDEEDAWIEAHGPIRYVFNDGFPPFTLVDEFGAVRGINRDLLRLMSVDLGLEFVMVEKDNFTQTLQAIITGEADVAGNLGMTPERAKVMDFTSAYAVIGISLWVHEGTTLPADMARVKIAAVRGTGSVALAEQTWPGAEVILVDDIEPGLRALREGAYMAFLSGEATTAYAIQQERYFDITMWGAPLETRGFSFAVPKGETILLSILEKGLAGISRDERAAIFVKWTGRDLNAPLPVEPTVPMRIAAFVALGVLAAGGAILVPLWIVTLQRRVTARTREIRRLNAALEARVAERTRELEIANRELEAFAYSVSHDLRAPLRAIDGFSKALAEDAGDKLDPAARGHVERVRAATQRMGLLVDDLLRLSRMGRAEMSVREVDLTALAEGILRELRTRDPTRQVATLVEPGLRAKGDPQLLEVALTNLLENAWKFTSRREKATIEIGRTSTPRGAGFFVRDDGAGFEGEFAGKLFVPFQRLHSAAEFPGTGIGLALVKRVIARHGGDVWATGAPGEGATFSFTLPQDHTTPERTDPRP